MRFKIEFEVDNAGFRYEDFMGELAGEVDVLAVVRQLRAVEKRLTEIQVPKGGDGGVVRDVNGNTVGSWGFEGE